MNSIKQIFIDSFNGLPLEQIPLFLFQLLMAGLMGHLLQKIANRKFGNDTIQHGGLIATGVALLTSIVKYSLPFAVIAAALILLLGKTRDQLFHQTLGLFLVALVGLGCGVGSVVQTCIGLILVSATILFIPIKK